MSPSLAVAALLFIGWRVVAWIAMTKQHDAAREEGIALDRKIERMVGKKFPDQRVKTTTWADYVFWSGVAGAIVLVVLVFARSGQ